MTRTEEQNYGCFRCGTVNPPCQKHRGSGRPICGVCGEDGIITQRQALDMLNNIYLQDESLIDEARDYDEYYLDYEEGENE